MSRANRLNSLAAAALRSQPDGRLASLARNGYSQGFEEIARRYRASLVHFAGSIVPAHRAEDVVQDALVKAYRSLPKSDRDLNLRPWLYQIVRNTALNDLRDERVHDHLDENWDGVRQPPDVAAHRAELAALVARIRELPAPQREALVKRELEGRSHEEIAEILGATPGAVRALIYRARTTLRGGVGMLIPMPVLRALLDAGPQQTEAAGLGIGGAAAGLSAGSGGAIALKASAALVVGALAVGSGVAMKNRDGNDNRGDPAALASKAKGGARQRPGGSLKLADGSRLAGPSGHGSGSDSRGGPGPGGDSGHGSSDSGGDSGPSGGSGEGSGEDHSGSGGGNAPRGSGGGEEGHGGSTGGRGHGSGTSGEGGEAHGGSSASSGHGSGDSGDSGSGTSGSGSSGHGSGSSVGSSGSGSGDSGDSGSGTSGSGSSGPSSEGGHDAVEEPSTSRN